MNCPSRDARGALDSVCAVGRPSVDRLSSGVGPAGQALSPPFLPVFFGDRTSAEIIANSEPDLRSRAPVRRDQGDPVHVAVLGSGGVRAVRGAHAGKYLRRDVDGPSRGSVVCGAGRADSAPSIGRP